MIHRSLVAVSAACLMAGFAVAAEPAAPVYEMTRVHAVHIELTAKEFERLQAVKGGFAFGARPAAPPAADPPGEPIERHRSAGGFGLEFPWARATFTIDGQTFKELGLRFKGNGSYLPTAGKLKRNFKVDLDHYDTKLRFQGLKTLNLNAGAMDPTRVREALAFAMYREAGVPAPRTAFAEVTLTVPGKHDRETLGLYTLVEQLDKPFLTANFGAPGGLLVKPERLREFDYLGEDWERYKARYLPKDEATPKQARRVIDFARLVHRADDAEFARDVGSFLDIDAFLRFHVVTAMLANMDSVFFGGHNYAVYLHPMTDKFVFIPWDVDLAFAGFPFLTTSDQQLDLSLIKPYGGTHRLADRLMAVKEIAARHGEIAREIAGKSFTRERLLKHLEAVEAATRDVVQREQQAVAKRKEPPVPTFFANTPDIRKFVDRRIASIEAQLAGKSKGFVPPSSFGGPRPGGAGGGAAFLTRPLLEALDADKDQRLSKKELLDGAARFVANADKERNGKLDEKALADEINRIFPLPAGFGNAGAARGERFPGGFGPGNFMAGALLRKADADKDGCLTLDELTKSIESTFEQTDKEKKGSIDEKQLGEGLRQFFPPPPGFGRPMPMPPTDKPKGESKP